MGTQPSPQKTGGYVRLTEQDWQDLKPPERVYVAHRGKPSAAGTVD
jgi:hypothetical protein